MFNSLQTVWGKNYNMHTGRLFVYPELYSFHLIEFNPFRTRLVIVGVLVHLMKKVEGPLLGSRDKAFIFAGIQDWAFIFHGMGFTLIRTINFSGAGNNVLFFREFGMTTLSSFSQLILLIDCCLKIYTSTKNHLMLKFFHC